MSNYLDHLDREWEAMGWPKEDDDDPQVWIYRHLRKLLNAFDGEGHSGTSAPYTINLFRKLASFEPIGPLTGADSEWNEVGDSLYQNNRCGHVFKEDGQAYDSQGKVFREPDGVCFKMPRQNSRRPVLRPGKSKSAGSISRRGSGHGAPDSRRSIGQT